MTRATDLFVDEMLDDVVRRMASERDYERAWWRNECDRINLSACNKLVTTLRARHRVPLDPTRINNLRGRCAEQRLVRRLCERRYDVRNQVRVGPRPGGSVLDISSFPGSRRRVPRGLESKYIHVPSYRGCASGPCAPLCIGALVAGVPNDVLQVRRHMAHSVAGSGGTHRAGLPARIRLFYQLGGAMSDAEFRCLARELYAAVTRANRQPPGGPQVAATVVRASRLPAFR